MAVHKYGHFAKAAQACQVTQPTLSMQIQKLESELGVAIFDRSKKPVLLTGIGKKLVDQMQTLLVDAHQIENVVRAHELEGLQGELSLAVIPTLAPYVLPRALPVMEATYPKMRLKMSEMQTHRIIEALDNDEIEVGLLATPLNIPSIHEYPLFYEPFSILCKKTHPLSHFKRVRYSQLTYDDLWLLEEGHCLRNQALDVCSLKKKNSQKTKYEFESGSLETLKFLVDAYGGYTLLPALATSHTGPHTTLIPFERPIPAREVGLVYRREHYKHDLIEALGEVIIKAIPEEIRRIRSKDLDVLPVE